MTTKGSGLLLFFWVSIASGQIATRDDIDVLFIFDSVAYTSIPNKESWVEANQNAANAFLAASGVPSELRFDFRTATQAAPYNATNKTVDQVLNWMNSSGAAALWSTIRGDNDLIFLVTATYNSAACGKTSRVENNISILNGQTKYFMTMRYSGCADAHSRVIAHELGHSLYADHQLLYNQDGTIDLEDTEEFMDTNVFSPESYNHAWSNIADTQWTMMGFPTSLSKTLGLYSSGDTSRGEHPDWHDVTRIFGDGTEAWGPVGDKSWTTVSRYRPLMSPSNASNFRVEWLNCSGSVAMYAVTWGGQLNYPTDYFEVQQKIGSSWYPWYDGLPGCQPHSTGSQHPTFRIRTVSIGGVTVYIEATGNGNCSGGGQNPF